MNNKRASLAVLATLALFALLVAAVLGAGYQMKWWLLGSGGGSLQGPGYGLASAIGQPVSGRITNGYTIYSGLYFSSVVPGPGEYKVFLPAILNNSCFSLPGGTEIEPNDKSATATGPLCPGVVITGNPDNHGSASDYDWFYFNWSGTGSITIDLTNFLPQGQLLLYGDPPAGYLARDWDQASGHYIVNYTGTGRSGWYYILVFAPDGHVTGNGDYALTYQ